MKVGNPLGMSTAKLLLAINVLQGLMIGDEDELLLHEIMTSMLQRLHNGVEFQIISRIILLRSG